jgi:hypothetical protein
VCIFSQKPGNIEPVNNDHNLKNTRLNFFFFNANVFIGQFLKNVFCLWVVFWQARMPKICLAAASIPEWPKTASKTASKASVGVAEHFR